jgi:hypothetical protein
MYGFVVAGILLFVASVLGALAGLVLLTIRGVRRKGLYTVGGSILAFLIAMPMIAIGDAPDREAKELGFADAADRTAAFAEGFTEPKRWAELKAARAAEKARVEQLAAEARASAQREQATRAVVEQAAAAEKAITEKRAEEARCREDLQCIGDKKHIEATFACKRYVENLAKNDYQWVDGWSESKFSRFRFKGLKHDTITYVGDKIQFQNGMGAWIRHIYECDYNIDDKTVIDVRARQGRLPS